MATALPAYLGKQFDDCPPGHRFGLYFNGWQSDWQKPANKTPAFKEVADAYPPHTRDTLAALGLRQQASADQIGALVLAHPARLSAPLSTGLGNEHPLENGFAFLSPYGLPYLAGSGVKGVLRRAAEELASGDWGDNTGWDQASIDALFGLETASGDNDSARTRGALIFWDMFFHPPKGKSTLAVEIMTPHHTGYLQSSGTPHANESPNPIPFLAIPARSECTLYVRCTPAMIPSTTPALHEQWTSLIVAAIEHAGEWLGFGAKTAVGYGRLGQDAATRKAAFERAQDLAEATVQAALEARLAELPAQDRQIAEFAASCDTKAKDERKDPFTPGSGLFADALRLSKIALDDENAWSATQRLHLAETLAEWLPKVIEKLGNKDSWKDARKKLQLAKLRGE